jgi:integrase
MPKQRLTDISVRALNPPATGQLTVWDKQSPVGVRVSQGGSKTFIVLVGSGQRRTIGRVGIISLADARIEAKRVLAEKTLGLGGKPSAIKFEAALTLFLEAHYKTKRERTKVEIKRLLERHFLPAFRNKGLSEITDADITVQLAKLARTPSEQLHAFRALRTMLRWATRPPHRYLPHSPLEGYTPPSEDRKGKRTLTDIELTKVWRSANASFGAMVRLLILWGARNGEVGRIKRTWIEQGVITIPGSHTKNGREHAIPLLPMARAVLAEQRGNGDYFFPGRWSADTHFADGSWGKLKRNLDKRSGVSDWQLRDIRRTFRSSMPKLGIRREIAERLLNHVSGKNMSELDEIYDRYEYIVEKRQALEKWEQHIADLLARR